MRWQQCLTWFMLTTGWVLIISFCFPQMHHPIQMKPADSEKTSGRWLLLKKTPKDLTKGYILTFKKRGKDSWFSGWSRCTGSDCSASCPGCESLPPPRSCLETVKWNPLMPAELEEKMERKKVRNLTFSVSKWTLWPPYGYAFYERKNHFILYLVSSNYAHYCCQHWHRMEGKKGIQSCLEFCPFIIFFLFTSCCKWKNCKLKSKIETKCCFAESCNRIRMSSVWG